MHKRIYILSIICLLSSYLALCQTIEYEKVYNYDTIYTKPDTVFVNVVATEIVYDTINAFWNIALSLGADYKNMETPDDEIQTIVPLLKVNLSYFGSRWYANAGLQYSQYKHVFPYDFWEEIWVTPTTPEYEHNFGSHENNYHEFKLPITTGLIFDLNSFSILSGVGFGIQYTFAKASNLVLYNKALLEEKQYRTPLNYFVNSELRFVYYTANNLAVGADVGFVYLINENYKNIEFKETKHFSINTGINLSFFF